MQFNYEQGARDLSITLQNGDGVLVYTDYQQRVRWEATLVVSGSRFVLRRRSGWRDVDLGFVNRAVVKLAKDKLGLDLSVVTVHVAYLPATN